MHSGEDLQKASTRIFRENKKSYFSPHTVTTDSLQKIITSPNVANTPGQALIQDGLTKEYSTMTKTSCFGSYLRPL